ncbi:MAG: cysteine--tRNA ligase [Actinobacteria bacterium]|nr:cysteine--tRNA ligase [Propionicimonas sp.]MBU3975422.1 cysteine--tRNA ligase [Actinomycetota bacterium]MBU3986429.1 cysteine--tRNA ligase [Actinomycetota bacterium]MBU4007998.1 cysteine--tRNA ligase [Actinomycetota bacterium]MBU4064256.1 cysteine--tRNA ligase [Actinomycetota bacterium]
MSFHLYDSVQRKVVEFAPLVPGEVSIYCCGATVQGAPHLGHVRKEVNFDVLRRWLEHSGNRVTMLTNITDIDDKILAKSAEAGRPWWAHAFLFEAAFHEAFRALGVRLPTYEPRATGHIPEMIELMAILIERGHAYAAADGSGDVYFDVRSWPSYGELSGMKIEEMTAAEDADPRGKRDPRDFALWKGAKPGDPDSASWETPWGRGRPGWHLECSAMAGKYLGDAFDIHGGGLDLRFPHHENEIAQSKAAGRGFASYWMHNAWVTLAGEKMSKSLGNTADVLAAVNDHGGRAVRLYLAGPHYRSAIELSEASLTEAAAQLARIDGFLSRAKAASAKFPEAGGPVALPVAFTEAMDDDLGTPGALATVFNTVKAGNVALDAGDLAAASLAHTEVLAMLDIFGLNPSAPEWAGAETEAELLPVVDGLVAALLEQRTQARTRKDWAAADAIRDQLAAIGLQVTDTADGPRWSLEK